MKCHVETWWHCNSKVSKEKHEQLTISLEKSQQFIDYLNLTWRPKVGTSEIPRSVRAQKNFRMMVCNLWLILFVSLQTANMCIRGGMAVSPGRLQVLLVSIQVSPNSLSLSMFTGDSKLTVGVNVSVSVSGWNGCPFHFLMTLSAAFNHDNLEQVYMIRPFSTWSGDTKAVFILQKICLFFYQQVPQNNITS